MPFANHGGISKNIESREERDRIKGIIKEIAPDTGGLIVRTEAEDATREELQREVRYLTRLWQSINSRMQNVKAPALVHRDLGIVFQTVRDYFTEDVKIMLIDNKKEYEDVRDFVKVVSPAVLGQRVPQLSGEAEIEHLSHRQSGITPVGSLGRAAVALERFLLLTHRRLPSMCRLAAASWSELRTRRHQ